MSGKNTSVATCCKKIYLKKFSRSPQFGLYFGDNEALAAHHTAFHATRACAKCGKEVLEINLKEHMNGNKIQKEYKQVVSKGKVKAKAKSEESEPNVVKITGYGLFLQTKRPEIRNQNPDATPQDMIMLLN